MAAAGFFSLVRAQSWWLYKAAALLGLVYALINIANLPTGEAYLRLGLFLIVVIGTAAFGHVLNDFADLKADALAGKPNALAKLSSSGRLGLLGLTAALAWAPFVFLPANGLNLGLMAFQFMLFGLYSLPPIRLKERAMWGALADSLYGHTVPVAVAFATFLSFDQLQNQLGLANAALVWQFSLGMRNILLHQIEDAPNDLAANARTFVVVYGETRAWRCVSRLFLPLEAAAFLLYCAAFAQSLGFWAGWGAFGAALYFAFTYFEIRWIEGGALPVGLRSLLNRFPDYLYQAWLPYIFLAILSVQNWAFIPLMFAHGLIFFEKNAPFQTAKHAYYRLKQAIHYLKRGLK